MTEEAAGVPGSDRVIAALLLVLHAAAAAVSAFLGMMLVFVSDSCDGTSCNTDLIVTGMAITGLAPIGLGLVSLIHTVVRARRGRRVWWVPLCWLLVSAAVAAAGVLVAFQGGPNTFH